VEDDDPGSPAEFQAILGDLSHCALTDFGFCVSVELDNDVTIVSTNQPVQIRFFTVSVRV